MTSNDELAINTIFSEMIRWGNESDLWNLPDGYGWNTVWKKNKNKLCFV